METDSPQVLCSIRRVKVAALPEELVRQRVLSLLVEKGFPASLTAVEVPLKQFPHLTANVRNSVPSRRADIVCYANGAFGLYPLLLVECKAVKLSSRVVDQVVGYNHFVGARYVMIVNQMEMRVGWYDSGRGEYLFINYLPDYQEISRCPES